MASSFELSGSSSTSAAHPIQQDIQGDRNQTIGQVLGGMVIYVSGGQAIVNTSKEKPAPDEKAIPIGPDPYKGLMAFQETDGAHFFGREKQVATLWEKLRSLHGMEPAIRVLPIYGPSGSGKSSLARAGLIPELAEHPIPGYDRARVAILVPGTHPLESLATVLSRIVTQDLTPVTKTREFAGELKQVSRCGEYDGLRRIADVIPDIEIAPLVVLVDQFEEVYTLCKDKTERDAFIGNLLHAASDRAKRVTVIVTLRSDFLGETQKHAVLNQLFSEQGYLVPAMTSEELRQTIAKPAELAGHPLDTATIDLLVKDTEGREGALPLLQFALTRIWGGLAEGKQPAETLKVIGGVGGALAKEAQRIYDKNLNDEEKAIARRLFLGLVQLGEGTKDTRRRVLLDSLVSYQDQPAKVKRVIGFFSAPDVRLITLSANGNIETAEVTHETLFDQWLLLRHWLNENREALRKQRALSQKVEEWLERKNAKDYLLRGGQLVEVENFLQEHGNSVSLSKDMQRFVEKSIRCRNNRRCVAGFISATVILSLMGLTFLSILNQNRAANNEVAALSRAAEALYRKDQSSLDSLIAALRAGKRATQILWVGEDARRLALTVLQQSIYGVNERNRLEGHTEAVLGISFNPTSDLIATAGAEGSIKLWHLNGQEVKTLHERQNVNSVAFHPNEEILASATYKAVTLWSLQGQKLKSLPHQDWVNGVAFSPDGQVLATATRQAVILWDLQGQKLKSFPHQDWVNSVAFSPDGQILATATHQAAILWTLDGVEVKTLSHQDSVLDVAFDPAGKLIATASFDKAVKLWNLKGVELQTFYHENEVKALSFSADGDWLTTSSTDKTARIWGINKKREFETLKLQHGPFRDISLSPDGQTLATATHGEVRLWTLQGRELAILPHRDWVYRVVFSSNGEFIATISVDRIVKIWNRDGEVLQSLTHPITKGLVHSVTLSSDSRLIITTNQDGTVNLWDQSSMLLWERKHDADVYLAIFSPDGNTIATASADGKAKLWNLSGTELHTLPHGKEVNHIIFSPDGNTIATASADGTAKLWNLDGTELHTLPHGKEVNHIIFSPDGKIIATASDDGVVKLWSKDDKAHQTFRGHQTNINGILFSSDTQILTTFNSTGEIIFWDLGLVSSDLNEMIRQGCTWAQDYLSASSEIDPADKYLCNDTEWND